MVNMITRGLILISILFLSDFSIGQDSLKILSYNIQGMKPGTNSGFRLANIISSLKELDPDIIALQEINEDVNGDGSDNQCIMIAKALSDHFGIEYYYYQQQTHLSWDNEFKEFIGIISKHPVIDKGYKQLVTGVFPRKAVWNQIETPIGDINFFCTHLSFNDGGVRLEQVQQIDSYISEISIQNGIKTSVLCGDFNDQPNSSTIKYLTNTETDNFFFDSFYKVNPELPGYTVPSNKPSSRIDFVFYDNQSTISIDTSYVVMTEPIVEGLYYSDHLGVMSIFIQGGNTGINNEIHYNNNLFKLRDIYPNPYNYNVTLEYELFQKKHINITVYSFLGQELKVLLDGEMPSGKHSLFVDTSGFDNRASIIKIEVDGFVESVKLIKCN